MSTSLLYHAFGLRGYDYVNTSFEGGGVIFTIRQRRQTYRCSGCGSRAVDTRRSQERKFKAVPIGGKPVTVVFPIPRVACPTCGVLRQVPLNFADCRRSYTRSFERYALDLSRFITIHDVANHLPISWDTARGALLVRACGVQKVRN